MERPGSYPENGDFERKWVISIVMGGTPLSHFMVCFMGNPMKIRMITRGTRISGKAPNRGMKGI